MFEEEEKNGVKIHCFSMFSQVVCLHSQTGHLWKCLTHSMCHFFFVHSFKKEKKDSLIRY